jgi:signal transduction histidine kinase
MMALGKLSADLAHELNNPAAAIIRSASALKNHLRNTLENFKQMATAQLSAEQVDRINELLITRMSQTPEQQALSVLQRSQQEDEMAEWLEELGMDDGYEMAETLVDSGFDIFDLEELSEITNGQFVLPVIGWLHNMLNTERLVSEIEQASIRISDLVQSVKTYSHMDRAQDQQWVDLRQGIESMLSYKKSKNTLKWNRLTRNKLPK